MSNINFTVDIDFSALEALLRDARNLLSLSMNKAGRFLEGEISKESPVDVGFLQGSWRMEHLGEFDRRIVSGASYSLDVHEGSGPKDVPYEHIRLWASRKGISTYAWAIHRKILNEGTTPNPYTEKPIERTKERVQEFVRLSKMELGI